MPTEELMLRNSFVPGTCQVTRDQALRFLDILGFKHRDVIDTGVIILLEGAVGTVDDQGNWTVWTLEGELSSVWKGGELIKYKGRPEVGIEDVRNVQGEMNDVMLMVWRESTNDTLWFASCLANCNSGNRGRDSGWAQIADGLHMYSKSTYKWGSKPCLRATEDGDNRVLRDTSRDGKITLSEGITRGVHYNRSVLGHAMYSDPDNSSQGCWGVAGNYSQPPWKTLWRIAELSDEKLPVVVHDGGDFVNWVRAGCPEDWIPYTRFGSNSKWVNRIQKALGVTTDGEFGPKTGQALLDWRQDEGWNDEDDPGVSAVEIVDLLGW